MAGARRGTAVVGCAHGDRLRAAVRAVAVPRRVWLAGYGVPVLTVVDTLALDNGLEWVMKAAQTGVPAVTDHAHAHQQSVAQGRKVRTAG